MITERYSSSSPNVSTTASPGPSVEIRTFGSPSRDERALHTSETNRGSSFTIPGFPADSISHSTLLSPLSELFPCSVIPESVNV